jgi:hypothetical protein
MKSSDDDDESELALPLCPKDRPDAGVPELSLGGVPKGMPPVALLDDAEALEPEPEGVPNPEAEDEDEGEDKDGDEVKLEPDGMPNPEVAAEAKAELDDINPPGTFIPSVGWPPALALEGVSRLFAIEPETCEPPAGPTGGPG